MSIGAGGVDRLRAGHQRDAGSGELALRLDLVAHAGHYVGVRPDEHEVVVLAGVDELRILREKPVTRMHGFAPRRLGRGDDGRDLQVALGGRRRPDADGAVRQPGVQRTSICGRVDGDCFDVELV